MKVTFIAHAGISIKEEGKEILIDPWFTDSSIEHPLIRAVWGKHSTIDFQIPKTSDRPENHLPDGVLVSHFHTHHAPQHDVMALADRSEKLLFGHPDQGERNSQVQMAFSSYPNVKIRAFTHKESEKVGPFLIQGLMHTVPRHIAWSVSTGQGSILHIADPMFNRDNAIRKLDPLWDEFRLSPDIVFINAGGNSLRYEKDGQRFIMESAAVSPVEAAQIVAHIAPRAASLIGCYNHSMWKNHSEYIPPAPQIEEEFYWALSWLAPTVKFIPLKPGHSFGIKNSVYCGAVDTYLP